MEPQPQPYQQPPAPQPPAPQKPRRTGLILATAFGVLAVTAGGVAIGSQVLDRGENTVATVTLPVVNGTTPETRAGEIYRQVQSGVVQIRTSNASGTGFVVNQNGTIVTNAHVVEDASTVRVIFDDGQASVEGKVTGRDVSSDLAAVKIDPDAVDKLTVLGLADSDKVKTGDEVLAIGYPLGLDRTATGGIVSGIGRQIKAQNGFSIDKVIQTDASINPGNSGGPLLDGRGRVIGVNSQIAATGSGSNTGIGFAVPSNTVRSVIPSLVSGQSIARPYLGVTLQPTDDDSGALIYGVTPGGPAAKSDLRAGSSAGSGDVVTAIDGDKVDGPDSLISKLDAKKPGDRVTLTVDRDGSSAEVDVTLTDRPANATAGGSSSPGGGGGGGGQDSAPSIP